MRISSVTALVAVAVLAVMPTTGSALQRRQVSCTDIGRLFTQVNTALFAVNYMSQAYHPCNQAYLPFFNNQGLLGTYALNLICLLDAEKIQGPGPDRRVFNESLSVVNDNLIVTLTGLFDAAAGVSDPSRNISCAKLDTNILNEAQLPGALIQSIICDFTTCTPPVASSSSVVSSSRPMSSIMSSSSVSSAMPYYSYYR